MKKQTENIIEEDIAQITDKLADISKKLEGRTVLITGGSGFLGKYIIGTIYYLNKNKFKNPCKVISLDNYITSAHNDYYKIPKNEYINYKKKDVTKTVSINSSIDYIIHAAGIASPIYYQRYPLETIKVAVDGTKNMLDLAVKRKVKSFLYFSSSEIYGNPTPDAIPTKETYNGNVSSIGPRSCYDESKRLGETYCMNYFTIFKTPIKMVRPFNIYGPGMRPNDYRVIPSFIFNALHKKPLPVHLKGRQTRAFCYIADATVAIFKVLLSEQNGEVYNIGNDEKEIDMNELAQTLNSVFDKKLVINHIPYPKDYPAGEPQRRCPSLKKIRSNLDYKPAVTLKDGLARTSAWCRVNWR